jgi:aspartyl-tRNA(Asn)/glutamyl-tRNA(Gln) amidotransferase subunit A
MLGTYALSAGYYDAYYLKAQKVRTLLKQDFDQTFAKFDALITPTSPTVPFEIGQKTGDPVQMYLSDICTLSANIAGIPAISIPAGFVGDLPVGMQLMAKPFAEETLFRIAFAYEQATEWHKRRPAL